MSSHSYYTRSVAQRRKAYRPSPLDLKLVDREKRKYSLKKNEINLFERAVVGMPKFSCNAATSMSSPVPSFTSTPTPSPKSNVEMSIQCKLEDNVESSHIPPKLYQEYGYLKASILLDIKRIVTNLENHDHDAFNLTKTDAVSTLRRYLKEFDISPEYCEVYAESKLLLFKNRIL